MNSNKENSRRQFLRNTALASLSAGFIPVIGSAAAPDNASGGCDPTTLDAYGQGPFYTANAPILTDNQLALANEPGTRLVISGVVRTLDCSLVIPNTLIDVWHANDAGAYDTVGYNLRGITYSNAQGFYIFETILPGKYLNGASYRPRHIHFRITPPGFPTLITQLYFEGDTDIAGDAAASVTSGTYDATKRIIPLTLNAENKYEGTWDIVVNGSATTTLPDLHLDKGMLYQATPNPFSTVVQIHYGIFEPAQVALQIFDIRGALIATLDKQYLTPQKYVAIWHPDSMLPAGVYFIALRINDLQVHYVKTMKL
jgi:protocatechuate 3,4-dioxygenase beta subunit